MAATAPSRLSTILYNGDNTNLTNPTILTTDGIDTAEITYNIKIPAGIPAGNYIAVWVQDPRYIKAIISFNFHSAQVGGDYYPIITPINSTIKNDVIPGIREISFGLAEEAEPIPENYYLTVTLQLGRSDVTHS